MRIILFCAILLATSSCDNTQVPLPKPRIYPKVTYPIKEYVKMDIADCPFTLDVPTYFEYAKDDKQSKEEKKHQCWFDLYCESLNTYVHLSYINFDDKETFDNLIADAFEMADKHNIKASYRQELAIEKAEENVHGLIFEIDGPVATPMQFFVTDSTQHFLRASLYFKSSVNRDSVAPIYDFLKVDMGRMIESFEWSQ